MNNDYKKELEFIKNVAKNGTSSQIPKIPTSGFDKKEVQKRLKELGLDSLAEKLESMSNETIENMIKQNPQIIKKASEILNGGR